MIIAIHCALLGLLCGSVLITPDHSPWASPSCIWCYSQIPSWNAPPWPWGTWPSSKIMWSSCYNHATTCHPVSRPSSWQTWDLRVTTLFLFNLFLSYCMLILSDCSAVPTHIPVLNPDLEANCMCPCVWFASLSPLPPCRQLP